MPNDFRQTTWDNRISDALKAILQLALREDLGSQGDWTTQALVPEDAAGRAEIVAREPGIAAGLPGTEATLRAVDPRLGWSPKTSDGQAIARGQSVGTVEGPARAILAAERIALNLLGRLSGIATLTRRYVDAVAGTETRVYDTRKTTPGWRRLEKYAVRCGGGWSHRGGLDEAVLIKDNHLALGAGHFTPAEAVRAARQYVADKTGGSAMPIEVEVDTLAQLERVLPARPDIVLLDNMTPDELRKAVALRNVMDRSIVLEASGGVTLETIREIAETRVDRISVGALTHSAVALDFGLDWFS